MVNASIYGKCVKKPGRYISELEKTLSGTLCELQSSDELNGQLDDLYFCNAQEIQLSERLCILVEVPFSQLRDYQKVHQKVVRELEKKFSGAHVIIVAKRRILKKPMRGKNRKPLEQKRPRSRTLTAVHDALLADIVYPAEVVGRRTRIKLDGKQLHKVHLDKAQQTSVEHKVDTFANIYKRITGKDVVFEFPQPLL